MDDWGFEIGKELGSGSTGFVQRVRRRRDSQEFAAKRVRSTEQEQLRALEDEYKLLQGLSHSSIVQAEAFFQDRASACLCMELCGGGSLSDHVAARGAFSEAQARELSLQLLEGLDYLHCRCRVVHRDIKPANLLLLPGAARLKIGDFGSARRVGPGAVGGAMLSERGTQLYAAPELRFGLQWNERVDIWASGLCTFVMLRAELPFDSGSRLTMRLLRQGHLPRISWGHVEDPITRSLVLQCITVEMRDRPSAMELLRHPAFVGHCPGTAGTAVLEPGGPDGSAPTDWLPACGLLAGPVRRAGAESLGMRSPFEQALRQLVRYRFLRMTARTPSEELLAHRSPL